MRQTIQIPATQAQRMLSEIFEMVSEGKKVMFTKYGTAIGVLEPVKKKYKINQHVDTELIDFLRQNAIKTKGPVDTTEVIRNMRDEK